ncbi:MAG: hypothetical protein GY802_09315 [Gammaproteobacteria bacterium]|nr:hypothetical protein [Gammaproteobacteria bacterium]
MSKTTFLLVTLSFLMLPSLSQSAAAEEKKYTECAAIRMKEVALKHLATGNDKYTMQIPEGWTVVGGTGGEGHPKLLVCR